MLLHTSLVMVEGSDWGEAGCGVNGMAIKGGQHEVDIFPNNKRVGVGQFLDWLVMAGGGMS